MQCIICSEDINQSSSWCYLNCNCNYIYHSKCINQWFNQSKSCPTCRKEFIKKDNIPQISHNEHIELLNNALFYDSIGRWSSINNRNRFQI